MVTRERLRVIREFSCEFIPSEFADTYLVLFKREKTSPLCEVALVTAARMEFDPSGYWIFVHRYITLHKDSEAHRVLKSRFRNDARRPGYLSIEWVLNFLEAVKLYRLARDDPKIVARWGSN